VAVVLIIHTTIKQKMAVDVGEDALPGWSVWGDVVSLLGAANKTTKMQKLKYVGA
jgi:hypothetical protein